MSNTKHTPEKWYSNRAVYTNPPNNGIYSAAVLNSDDFYGEAICFVRSKSNEELKRRVELIASAPSLLKENEELKRLWNISLQECTIEECRRIKAESLNAELLEALKGLFDEHNLSDSVPSVRVARDLITKASKGE